MKRSLSVLFLVTFLVLPLFATDKGKTEIDIKLGLNVNPTATASIEDIISSIGEEPDNKIDSNAAVEGKMQYTIGVEGYYFIMDNLGIGLGVTRAFPTGYINEFINMAVDGIVEVVVIADIQSQPLRVTTDSPMLISFGEERIEVGSGTHSLYFTNPLVEGENTIEVAGSGTITIDYRGGRL